MSFNYPGADLSIQKGNSVYRIKAQTTDAAGSAITGLGPGDLIPINTGFSAIAVGPESDYENYELLYFDPTAPGGVQRVPFSVKAPFIGNINADNIDEYPGSDGEKAIAFVRIADVGTLEASVAGGAGNERVGEAYSDLLIYTGDTPQQLPTARNRLRRASNVPVAAGGATRSFYIPGYGRRIFFASCIKQFAFGAAVTMEVKGVRLYHPLVSDSSLPSLEALSGKTVVQATRTQLLAPTAVPNVAPYNDPLTFPYDAENPNGEGFFDFYHVLLRSDVDALPSDFPRGQGVHLTMEVRD